VKRLTSRRRHPFAAFVVLLLALGAVGGIYAMVAPSGSAEAASGPTSVQVDEGKSLFLTSCSSCHGLHAESSSDGPSLMSGFMIRARASSGISCSHWMYSAANSRVCWLIGGCSPLPEVVKRILTLVPSLASIENAWYFEADGSTDNPLRTVACSASYTLSGAGTVTPLDGPGLGVEVDEDYLRAHPLTDGPAWH